MRKCGKILQSRQATDDNMAHAHCMLGAQGYKHTHSEYVTLTVFSTATMAASVLCYTYIACVIVLRVGILLPECVAGSLYETDSKILTFRNLASYI